MEKGGAAFEEELVSDGFEGEETFQGPADPEVFFDDVGGQAKTRGGLLEVGPAFFSGEFGEGVHGLGVFVVADCEEVAMHPGGGVDVVFPYLFAIGIR